ncbi:MAG: glycine cleavage system aminomethyltransferase GcvT [Vicinamibacterales bacterium]
MLKKTPLNAWHRAHGARMVPFAGWDMPVEYTGVASEHLAVRTRAGLFDVSHMGQLEIAGPEALAAVQLLTSNDAGRLKVGQAQYSALMLPNGAFVDDLLVYRLGTDHFLMVVNASNTGKDFAWILDNAGQAGDASVVDSSSRYALIAVQGPLAREIVQPLASVDLSALKYYWFAHGEVAGARATVSRTGYTGEDGVEIFVPPAAATKVWDALLNAGTPAGMIPAGLGARDTLRLEAGMRLYGNDIDDTTTVLEADLEWIVGWDKQDFIGRQALAAQKARGLERRLAGFEMLDRAIARRGHDIYVDGVKAGFVTSGTLTPFLKKAVGMAYLPAGRTGHGTEFEIDVRGRRARARVVPLPFYKRPRG